MIMERTKTLLGKDINQLTFREAMLLPNYFTGHQLDDFAEEFENMRFLSKENLVQTISNNKNYLVKRYVAGLLLGLLGDSRINIFEPNMVEIPGNTICIGLAPKEIDEVIKEYATLGVKREWIEKEAPAFKTSINSFKISKYLVTNQEFRIFLQDTKYPEIPTSWAYGKYPAHLANHPVYSISPEAAESYARWLSKKTKRKFRLPTEIEWEYAAAGPEKRVFPWGNKMQFDSANTCETGIVSSTPVGMFPSGATYFGIEDMAGNVEEYVADNYWVYPGGRYIQDDLANRNPNYRITRGGSFARFYDLARCTRRHGQHPNSIYVIGFRLAEDAT